MSSNAQTAANIANAQASTGPTTEQGKQRSSQNALKHGLTASAVLIPCEDPAAFEAFRRGLHEHWNPRGNGEFIHVEEMIVIQWRLRRCERIEAVIFSADVPDFKTLNNVSLHAARLKRQYSATFKELLAMQERRCNRDEIHLEQAEDIRRADAGTIATANRPLSRVAACGLGFRGPHLTINISPVGGSANAAALIVVNSRLTS